ncbi:MAG: NAD(P)H-dependent oxidoreductase [Propionibacteriaceae bacterium]|nr:NAD(P)H-dependent oxidoreductase [Propionibacteriaceae bacterium]
MRVMVVLDHPYGAEAWDNTPHHRSFTAALAHAAVQGLGEAGHEIDLVDLHADGFNPVMSAEELTAWRQGAVSPDPLAADYQQRLLAADHLVLAFPIWWEAMPAGTKGFIDKVVAKGVAYHQGKGLPPMTNATKLTGVTLITVMSTPTVLYKVAFSSAISRILLRGTFRKIGIPNLTWLNYARVEKNTLTQRQRMLTTVSQRFARLA